MKNKCNNNSNNSGSNCDETTELLFNHREVQLSLLQKGESCGEIRPAPLKRKGLNTLTAAIFIAGEMAGSGVLALPKAIVSTGWIGIIMLVLFCINSGYSGVKLGNCWEIIEERYPEHRLKTRNPYSVIGYRAAGKWGCFVVSNCIRITLFGAGTVYLLLSSQIIQELIEDVVFNISSCIYFLLIALCLTPPMWLGSPKDFRIVGIGALLTTAIACVLYFVQMVNDGRNKIKPVRHEVHGFQDFFLAFGTLLFAFGGASTFPTIQNDMNDKNRFSSSVIIAFVVIIVLYLPVTAAGFFVFGEEMQANFAMSLSKSILVDVANTLMAVHLIFAFLIVINPVCQELEETFKIPNHFNTKRCFLRSGIVLIMIVIGESIPRFSKILSLIGGSTITLLTFVFPPYFYMKLCNQSSDTWPKKHIPLQEKIYMWELITIGVVGGTASTYSAVQSIFGYGSFTKPCYWPF